MRLRRAAALSLRSLLAHRLRSTLALASVAVGVAGVLLTSALGKGAEAEARRSLEAAGANLLVVRPAQVRRSAARRQLSGVVTSLSLEDSRAIAHLTLTSEAAPGIDAPLRARAGSGSMSVTVLGTSPSLARLRRLRVGSGRFFDAEDDAEASRVAVLGARVASTLFSGDPLGEDVRLRGLPFEVIGVLEPRGVEADGSDQDGSVFIPIRTALRRVFNASWITTVFVSVADRPEMAEESSEIRTLLRERHRIPAGVPDDFAVQDQTRLLEVRRQAIEALSWFTGGLAGVSMLVGGAGILALMLLSVKERTGEIGLRMALGARRKDVLAQFLGEAALLSLCGWGAGTAAAIAGGAALELGTDWAVAVPIRAAFGSLLAASLLGVGSGALPARRAARLQPVDALSAAS